MKWIKLFEGFNNLNDLQGRLEIVRDILIEIDHSERFNTRSWAEPNEFVVIIELKEDFNEEDYDEDYDGDDVWSIDEEVWDSILRIIDYMRDYDYTIMIANDEAVPPGGNPDDYMTYLTIDELNGADLAYGDFIRIDFKNKG
jgi:hypothetical protein